MPLVPPEGAPREKILVYGGPKVGKTSAHLSIATMYLQTETPGKFWIIDTDDAMDRMLFGKNMSNVEVLPATTWMEYREASDKVVANAQAGDWIVVDFIDRAWQAVRNWFFDEYLEEAPDEYFARKKHELKKENRMGKKYRMAMYEDIDWDVVNPQYDGFIKPMVVRTCPAHLFFVCEEKAKWIDNKPSEETKPGGHSGLPFQVHSLIKLDKLSRGRLINNVQGGDRERPELKNETYENFCLTYLCKTAGWSIQKGGE